MSKKNKKTPLIIELDGRLGNQLFQYVFGQILLSQLPKDKYVLYYDFTNFLRGYRKRPILLHCVSTQKNIKFIYFRYHLFYLLKARVATSLYRFEKVIHKFYPYNQEFKSPSFLAIVEKNYSSISNNTLIPHIIQKIQQEQKPVFVRGFWQKAFLVENYLKDNPQLLSIKKQSSKYIKLKEKILQYKNSVSIHIRRADYLDSQLNQSFPNCSILYYLKAVSTIQKQHPKAHFFLFSDDNIWLIEFIKAIKNKIQNFPTNIISNKNNKITDYEELFLMAHCKHHILANSTYSWWASMIYPQKSKTVIAPKKWHINSILNKDIALQSWKRL